MNKRFFIAMTIISVCLLGAAFTYNSNTRQKNEAKKINKTVEIQEQKQELEDISKSIEANCKLTKDVLEEKSEENIEVTYTDKYAVCSLNIRTHASVDSDRYTTVKPNTKLSIVDGFKMGDWVRVMYDGKELYVNSKYLSDKPVVIKKKAIVSKPQSQKETYNTINQNNSNLMLLARLVNAEVGSLNDEAQIACASVVLNRVNSSAYPNSIKGVIYQKGQYSVVRSGRINRTPSDRAIKNAKYVLEHGSQIPSNVVYQSMGRQGSGVYKIIDGEYFCYK